MEVSIDLILRSMDLQTASIVILAILLIVIASKANRRIRPPLPPGPLADPFIGHIRIMPTENPELVFHEWAKKYGDIVYINCLGRSMIILDSFRAAVDLLEKRSANYSDRLAFTFYRMIGWGSNLAFLRYGERFRKHRKLLHSFLTPQACVHFRSIQKENAILLVKRLMDTHGDQYHAVSTFGTAIVMRIAYGHQIVSDDDEYIQIAERSAAVLLGGGPPGGNTVDIFPILKHCPSWFPGTYYARYARKHNWVVKQLHDIPYDDVRRQSEKGFAEPSFLLTQMQSIGDRLPSEQEVDDMKASAAALYSAGSDTTSATMYSFILAMLLYPECQTRAQEEIDRVVGYDRLPDFSDDGSLPYLKCLVQEVLRWRPPVPLGIPHRTVDDDIYRGMFIPKDTAIFANITGMSLDENTYANPAQFNPSRFLPKDAGGNGEQFLAAFGFGRRICPGRHLGIASVWIAVATILATLDISRDFDKDGREIIPDSQFTTGLASHPKPFICNISARSKGAQQLILQNTA